MQPSFPNPRHDKESGYVLLAVIFLTILLLLSLAIAAPKIATSIQRDKDLETIHRGEQYKRALQLYYRQFGSYPTSIDQLVSTNNMRFLRKRYTDPETGKDDWKPVYYGQAHVRPLGFFGQPLSAIGGIATAAVVGGMGSGMYALAPATTTDAEGFPVSDNGSGTSSDSPGSSAAPNSGLSSGSPATGSNPGTFSMGGQSNSGFNSGAGSNFGSSPGLGANGQSGIGTPGGTPTSGFGSSPSGFGSSSNGSSGGTFGSGGPIVGFTLPVNKPSLVDYKLQSRYNKWEFNYDPMEDQMQQAAGLLGGGGMSGTTDGMGTGGMNGTQGGFGNSNGLGGSNGLGNGNGFGGSNNNGFGQSGNGSSGSGPSGSGSSGSGSSGSGGSGSDNSGSTNPPTPPQQ